MSEDNTKKLASQYVDFVTNERGDLLANIFENSAFQVLYDATGSNARKARLPRKQLQVFNQLDTQSQLFQKVFYHPGLLQEDEQQLRAIFWSQSRGHDSLNRYVGLGMFAAYWPLMLNVSRRVKPWGCLAVTVGYYASWSQGVKPYLTSRLQTSLNSSAAPFAQKYNIKGDDQYL